MKKLVFMFVALAAVSFASCGSKTEAGAATDSVCDSLKSDSCCSDSAKCDSLKADSLTADSTTTDSTKA